MTPRHPLHRAFLKELLVVLLGVVPLPRGFDRRGAHPAAALGAGGPSAGLEGKECDSLVGFTRKERHPPPNSRVGGKAFMCER